MIEKGIKIRVITDPKKEGEAQKTFWEAIEKGKAVKARPKELVLDPKAVTKVFSPERIRLILFVRNNKIHSISELAKELNRPFESVHRDVKYLEGLGLINLKKHEKAMVPEVRRSITLRI